MPDSTNNKNQPPTSNRTNWWLFPLFLAITLTLAILYILHQRQLKNQTGNYEVQAVLLVNEGGVFNPRTLQYQVKDIKRYTDSVTNEMNSPESLRRTLKEVNALPEYKGSPHPDKLKGKILIQILSAEAPMIALSFRDDDAAFAADFLNMALGVYQENHYQVRTREAKNSLRQIDSLLQAYEEDFSARLSPNQEYDLARQPAYRQLLDQRMTTRLSLAAVEPPFEVIQPALAEKAKKVKTTEKTPSLLLVFLLALLAGILVPLGIIGILKLKGKKDDEARS